jgi:hypothetical protein
MRLRKSLEYRDLGGFVHSGPNRMLIRTESAVEVSDCEGLWLLGLDSNQQPSG